MPPIDTKTLTGLLSSPRWSTLVRADTTVESIRNWDADLLRQPRLLVPIDVQALYVPQNGNEKFVRLPFAVTTPDGQPAAAMPDPFAPGVTRQAGVYVSWAMPDSLLSGTMTETAADDGNALSLPALPDRWVVLRLSVGRGANRAAVAGWVLDAGKTIATPLADWPSANNARPATGKTIPPEQLTGTVGGALNWSGCCDAVENRFSFHDPLGDLASAAPNGVIGDFASYLVCGWWSEQSLDPLNSAEFENGLLARLDALKWRLVDDLENAGASSSNQAAAQQRQSAANLPSGSRHRTTASSSGPDASYVGRDAALGGLFAEQSSRIGSTVRSEPYSCLLHGVVHGVPVKGGVVADQRPSGQDMKLAFGFHSDDLASVLAAGGLNTSGNRRDVERLVSGFTHDMLAGIGTTNGVVAIEEGEHMSGFSSRPGGLGPPERVLDPGRASDLPGTRASRSAGAAAMSVREVNDLRTEVYWTRGGQAQVKSSPIDQVRMVYERVSQSRAPAAPPAPRTIQSPMPNFYEPMEPMLSVSGAKRSLRHGFDRHRSSDGRLQCRWPSQVSVEIAGLINGADLVASFPAGGIPPEVVTLVRSAMILDPYIAPWRSDVATGATGFPAAAVRNRMVAESALRFRRDGSYGTQSSAGTMPSSYADSVFAAEMSRFSLIGGVDSDPVGVTAWSQPWVPMWLEWEVELQATDRLEGWTLGPIDLETADGEDPPARQPRIVSGRSPLHTGVAATLANAISGWLKAEDERDTQNQGEADEAVEAKLAEIAAAIRGIDILAASMDSLHDELLGLDVGPYGVLSPLTGTGKPAPLATPVPVLLLGGRLAVKRARIVDAFGRTLDLPAGAIAYPARDALTSGGVALRPRLLRPARWLFRLVDPDLTGTSREASIDQVEPTLMVNPVAGFLLPDHIDEALEFFDTAGNPIGQLFHDPISGGVAWEIAPGRDGPPDAGPGHGLEAEQALLGHMASAVVAEDAAARAGQVAQADKESALSALLRAIDTMLWTVDTYAVLGSTHVAGLVGRPIAVVRATLRLDINDDLDELDLDAPGALAAREQAYADLADRAFPVRIGELTRDDDGVFGFFVDDDYSRYHVVDKAICEGALDSGRGRGQLGPLGMSPRVPPVRTITHPFIVADDEIAVRPGQTVRLTILMHPGGKCHLTSGILPRKSLQLSRDWIHDGLAAIAPSARVGPVLIDADRVRLPLIASFGADQLWTRREGNFAWKTDPILAATQTALLPEMPSKVEEGYIRIAPIKSGTQ